MDDEKSITSLRSSSECVDDWVGFFAWFIPIFPGEIRFSFELTSWWLKVDIDLDFSGLDTNEMWWFEFINWLSIERPLNYSVFKNWENKVNSCSFIITIIQNMFIAQMLLKMDK